MGRMGGTCGAVTGAFMVLGLKYGNVTPDDQAAKDRLQALIEEFTRQFRARHRSLVCKELLGCDIGAPGGLAWARSNNLFKTRCVKYVEDAAAILEGMLTDKPAELPPA
jgi:C_GCAxxG_C_C family probable redox protein